MGLKRQKRWARFLTAILIAGMSTMQGTLVYAVETEFQPGGLTEIISQAGNAEMKALGEAYLLGDNISTVTTNDLAGGDVYYVDSINGDDANAGTSQSAPWRTIGKVNQNSYHPGDHILFKAGGTWTQETLSPRGAGTNGNPIVIGSYDSGAKPKFVGNGLVSDLIYLENQEYWEIRDLDISNQTSGFTGKRNSENGSKLKDLRGIRIAGGSSSDVLDGFYLHDLYIHDVSGEVAWISGTPTGENGIKFKTGWDGSKRTGGIVFEILEPAIGDTPTTFNNILIEKNVLTNNSFAGISIKQWRGDFHEKQEQWAARDGGKNSPPEYLDDNWHPHTNVTIQDNYLDHSKSDYACNTIYLTSAKGAVIQRNVSNRAGTSAIELYYTDDVKIQYNEVYRTIAKCGGADSNAIDPDKEATNALIQYNYIYETGDGILLCGFIYGSSVVRYNVIKDAEKRYINPHGDYGSNHIYNNILYNTRSSATVDFIASSGGDTYINKSGNKHYFYNNIFYNKSEGTTVVNIKEGPGTEYRNNCYFGKGIKAPSQDLSPVLSDPQFIGSPGSDAEAGLEGLKLKPTSPLINAGINIDENSGTTITGNGSRDYFGDPLYNGNADVGIFEYQGSKDGQGILSGYVTTKQGKKMAGAVVSVDGTSFTATADSNGYFSIMGIPVGTYTATVSKEIFENGKVENISIGDSNVNTIEAVLGESTSTTGSVAGKVFNSSGTVPYVDITLISQNGNEYKGKTGKDGTYRIEGLPFSENNYTLYAECPGYNPVTKENIEVVVGVDTVIDVVMSKEIGKTTYLINETFNTYDKGGFSANGIWNIVNSNSSNRISIEEDPDMPGNKYLKMNKTVNADMCVYNKNALGAQGIVTMEARLMRTNSPGSVNQFGIYGFNGRSGDWNTQAPASSSNPMATMAFTNGKIISHNVPGSSSTFDVDKYEQNRWYVIRQVINLDTNTFDIYLDDMNEAVAYNQPVRTSSSSQRPGIDFFNIFASKGNIGDLCVDYFRVSTGAPSNFEDNTLATVNVTDSELNNISLESDNDRFIAVVPSRVESLLVNAKAESLFACVAVNGQAVTKDNNIHVPLKEGQNEIPIVVTAESGKTKEYILLITRTSQIEEAFLTELSLEEVPIIAEFKQDIYEYDAQETDQSAVTLHYVPANKTCGISVKVNNKPVSGNLLYLVNGHNTIEVYVESADGANNVTYTIHIMVNNSQAEKQALQKLIVKAETFNESNYAEADWSDFWEKLEVAKVLIQNTDATPAELKSVNESLTAAIRVLTDSKPSDENYSTISIKVTKQPEKMAYGTGEEFDTTGLEVTVYEKASMSEATRKKNLTPKEYEIRHEDFESAGEKKVTIVYIPVTLEGEEQEFTDSFIVTVEDLSEGYYTNKIKVTKKPQKTVYEAGEVFDPTGMEVIAYRKASSSEATRKVVLEPEEYEVIHEDFDTIGEKEITIAYTAEDSSGEEREFTDSFEVKVTERWEDYYTTKIRIKTKPKKLKYEIGEEFDPAGIVVVAYERVSSGGENRERVLTEDEYELDIPSFDTSGNKIIRVIYEAVGANNEDKTFRENFNVKVIKTEVSYSNDNDDNDYSVNISGSFFVPALADSISGTWYLEQNQSWKFQKADGTYASEEWTKIGGKWYHFNTEGNMNTGWLIDAEEWYFLNSNGSMKYNEWLFYNDFWYFLGEDGRMVVNSVTSDGYRLDSKGKWLK